MPGLTDTRPMTASRPLPAEPCSTSESRQLLWFDGVGGFLLLTGQAVSSVFDVIEGGQFHQAVSNGVWLNSAKV